MGRDDVLFIAPLLLPSIVPGTEEMLSIYIAPEWMTCVRVVKPLIFLERWVEQRPQRTRTLDETIWNGRREGAEPVCGCCSFHSQPAVYSGMVGEGEHGEKMALTRGGCKSGGVGVISPFDKKRLTKAKAESTAVLRCGPWRVSESL